MAQLGAELCRPTELVVACDPSMGQAREGPIQQIQRDPPLFLEPDFDRYVTFESACFVSRPILGQVKLAVQGTITRRACVSQENADLAIVHLAQPAAPLTVDAAGLRPFFGEGTGVDNHYAIWACEFFADMGAQLGH